MHLFVCDPRATRPQTTNRAAPVRSPNGRHTAQVQASNLVVRSASGKEIFRTTDGDASNPYTGALETGTSN